MPADFYDSEEREAWVYSATEDRARTFREWGYPGYHPRKGMPKCLGDGPDSSILKSALGNLGARSPDSDPRFFDRWMGPAVGAPGRHLTASDFSEAYSAVAFANARGIIMDVSVSITWPLLGVTHADVTDVLTHQFFKPLREWLKPRVPHGLPFAWLYVHEVGRKQGFHTHVLLSVPVVHRLAFKAWAQRRFQAIASDGTALRGAFKITMRPGQRVDRQWRKFRYFFKGVDPEATLKLTLGPESRVYVHALIGETAKCPGPVTCTKLTGHAHTIGRAARKARRFQSFVERGWLDKRYIYSGLEVVEYHKSGPATMEPFELWELTKTAAEANEVLQRELACYEMRQKVDGIPEEARRQQMIEDTKKSLQQMYEDIL